METMNYSIIRYILCRVMEFAGIFLLLPCLVALIYGEQEGFAFLIVAVGCFLIGGLGKQWKPKSKVFYAKEGFVTVSLSWILLSVIGAIPFYLTGEIPSYVDALFETISGLTTTGDTILTDVEVLSRCTQFWRCFTHWIGGMGVLVMILAILPLSGSYNMHLMRAESPGPSVGKLVPKVRNTAKILYGIYIVITITEIILLCIAGMPLYDAITLSFSTAGTGGFGILNSSIADYSGTVQTIILIFMILCGVNFNVYYLFLIRKPKEAVKSEEVWLYLGLMFGGALLIAVNIKDQFVSMSESFFTALFHTASVMTTTGFSTVDFNLWPEFSKMILLFLILVGACAGSTGGGFKVSRLLLMFKSIKNELSYVVHPRSIKKVHMDGHVVSETVMKSTQIYVMTYVVIYMISVFLLSMDRFDFMTNFSAVAANLNNVGPGFGVVGPAGNFSQYSVFSKFVLMFDMLTGRLELFPMLILFSPKTWKR